MSSHRTLTTYDSQVDVTTGTIKMRATFDNPKGVLFPQQFVNVRLLVDTLSGVALAPNAAIQVGPSGNFVYALNADFDRVEARRLDRRLDGKRTTITSGLAAGDKVVIDGVDRLRDGAKVMVVENPPGGPAQGADGKVRATAKRRRRRPAQAIAIGAVERQQPGPDTSPAGRPAPGPMLARTCP